MRCTQSNEKKAEKGHTVPTKKWQWQKIKLNERKSPQQNNTHDTTVFYRTINLQEVQATFSLVVVLFC